MYGAVLREVVLIVQVLYTWHIRHVVFQITRNSYSQGSGGQAVSDPQPGDVVCYGGHVGIYAGGGQMIHAPQPGEVVCYTSVNYAYHWYRRYW